MIISKLHLSRHQAHEIMNWGTKLVIAMAVFIGFIISMGVIMLLSKTDALVETDYYEKGIGYDNEYRKKEQVIADHTPPDIRVSGQNIVLKFVQPANGNIRFLRPDDKKLDRNIPLNLEPDNIMVLPAAGFPKGRWRLSLNWKSLGKDYLYEKEIFIP